MKQQNTSSNIDRWWHISLNSENQSVSFTAKKSLCLWSFLIKNSCMCLLYWCFPERQLFERACLDCSVMFGDSRYSPAKEQCPCWNHPCAQFHLSATKPTWHFQELQIACVSLSVRVPDQWLKVSCVCQEMEIYYPSQLKKLCWCLLKGIGEFFPSWKVTYKAAGCSGWAGGGITCSPIGMWAPR